MNLKKQTMKDRWGNTVSYEFESPVKPIDQTALMKQAMEDQMGMGVPPMQAQGGMPPMPGGGHPGAPRGPDTVPAWLTPGEFVMNAEATRMFPQQIEQMNNAGRAVQRQQGGTIPQYKEDGGYVDEVYSHLPFDTDVSMGEIEALRGDLDPAAAAAHLGGSSLGLKQRFQSIFGSPQKEAPQRPRNNFEETPHQRRMRELREAGMVRPQYKQGGGEVVDALLAGGATPELFNQIGYNAIPGPEVTQGTHVPYGAEFDAPVPQAPTVGDFYEDATTPNFVNRIPEAPPQPEEGNWYDFLNRAGSRATDRKQQSLNNQAEATEQVIAANPDLPEETKQALQTRAVLSDQGVPEVPAEPEIPQAPTQRELPPGFVEDANQNIPEAPVTSDPEGVAAAETAGNEQRQTPEGEGFFQQVFSSMKDQFKDVFTPEEIAKYATLYLGSRALGGSHDGSLAYIGQQFNASRQAQAAHSAELAKEGRELEQYKAKKTFDAQLAGQAPADVATDLTKTHAYGEGRTAVKQVVDQAGNKVTKYIDSETGEIVSPDQFTDQRFVSGTQENLDFQKDVYGAIDTVTDEIYKRDGRVSVGSYGDGSAKYQDVGDLTPEQVKTRFVDWAGRQGVSDPTQLRTIYERSLKDYYGDAKFSGGKRSGNFEGFVNNQFIRAVGGQRFQDAFTLAPGKPGQPRKLADMEKATEITRAITSNINISNPRFKEELDKYGGKGEAMVQTAVIDDMLDTYKGISPSDLSFYKRLAKSEGETPEMAFMRVQLNLYPLGNIKTKPKQYYQ